MTETMKWTWFAGRSADRLERVVPEIETRDVAWDEMSLGELLFHALHQDDTTAVA